MCSTCCGPDGRDVRPLPLRERKRLLRGLLSFRDPLRFTEHRDADGEAYWREACGKGWEGVIAKPADSPYRPGRTRDGLKFKCVNGQVFVIGEYSTRGDPAPGSARCCWATTTATAS